MTHNKRNKQKMNQSRREKKGEGVNEKITNGMKIIQKGANRTDTDNRIK
jgi:hypothetical protein